MDFELAKKFIEKKINDFPEKCKEFYKQILHDISRLEKDEEVKIDIEKSKDIIRYFTEDLYEGSINDDRLRFFEGLSFLIYNWNNNTIVDKDIITYCICMKKFLTTVVLMKRSVNTMKICIEKFNRYKGWLPPVNDVSMKYLDLLFEKNEMENDKKDLEQNNKNRCCSF